MTDAENTPRRTLILVESPNAGRARRRGGLSRARAALAAVGLEVREAVPVSDVARLRPLLERASENAAEGRPLVVAAGGDGTVGAVADLLAHSDAVLGILPLGTSNDVARSLDIPLDLDEAARLLADGPVATVDLGHFEAPGALPRHFVHAASIGLNVAFAKVATRASVRKRLGRLTYMVALGAMLRGREAYPCTLRIDGRELRLRLIHLSVINAPVFGGFFGLRLHGSDVDDRRLDVLAIADVSLHRLAIAALLILVRRQPRVGGVRVYHARRLRIHVERPVEVSLDGELAGRVPGDFALDGEALRVVTGPAFVDVDDPVDSEGTHLHARAAL